MSSKLHPLFARVLIRREKLKSSLIIPESAERRNAPSKGRVVAKGLTADKSIKIGSMVLFGQHAGTWINEDGTAVAKDEDRELFVCQDEDIIAEVKEQ